MTIQLLLFAAARDAAGADSLDLEVPNGATFDDVANAAAATCPALADILPQSRFAADSEFVSREQPVDRVAEIALIPPVSGG